MRALDGRYINWCRCLYAYIDCMYLRPSANSHRHSLPHCSRRTTTAINVTEESSSVSTMHNSSGTLAMLALLGSTFVAAVPVENSGSADFSPVQRREAAFLEAFDVPDCPKAEFWCEIS